MTVTTLRGAPAMTGAAATDGKEAPGATAGATAEGGRVVGAGGGSILWACGVGRRGVRAGGACPRATPAQTSARRADGTNARANPASRRRVRPSPKF